MFAPAGLAGCSHHPVGAVCDRPFVQPRPFEAGDRWSPLQGWRGCSHLRGLFEQCETVVHKRAPLPRFLPQASDRFAVR